MVLGGKINSLFLILLMIAHAAAGQTPVKPAPVPERLYNDLKNKDAFVRRAAINELGALRARDATARLIAALSYKDAGVREAAAFALGQIANRAAAEPLARALADQDAEVRASAAFALGMIGDQKSIEALSDALGDSSDAVRSSAIVALGVMRDAGGVDEVIAMLNDPSFDVRYDAVWALGQMGEQDAIEHVRAALVGLDSLTVSESLRQAFHETAQNSIENIQFGIDAPTRPRRVEGVVTPREGAERSAPSKIFRPASVRQSARAATTERAMRARVSGAVSLRVLVGANSRPVRAYVTRRLGYGLDQRAVEAVLQYRFNPAMQAGLPQTDWMSLEIKLQQ
jgi:vesicle coat complex subunit